MTKEEREKAIAYGKEQLEVFGGKHAEFIKLAIEILEQEPKKGKWLIEDSGKNKYTFCYCSNCNSYYTIDRMDEMNYCPNCGSYMTESED